MQTFAALFSFAVALSQFLCEGCYHSGYLVRTYTRNVDCSGNTCSIGGHITPGSNLLHHRLQVAFFSESADNNGSLSQLSRANLTRSGTFYRLEEVEFTWGTAQRVIVLLICLTDDSNCSLLEETQGKADLYRFPCSAQSKCHLCPQQREVLDNYTVSFRHGLDIRSESQSSYSNDCPTGTTRECIVPSSTADLTSVEPTTISTSSHVIIDFPTTSTSVDVSTSPTTSTSMTGSATSTGISVTTSPMSTETPNCGGSGVRPFSKLSLLLLVLCVAITRGVMCG